MDSYKSAECRHGILSFYGMYCYCTQSLWESIFSKWDSVEMITGGGGVHRMKGSEF